MSLTSIILGSHEFTTSEYLSIVADVCRNEGLAAAALFDFSATASHGARVVGALMDKYQKQSKPQLTLIQGGKAHSLKCQRSSARSLHYGRVQGQHAAADNYYNS